MTAAAVREAGTSSVPPEEAVVTHEVEGEGEGDDALDPEGEESELEEDPEAPQDVERWPALQRQMSRFLMRLECTSWKPVTAEENRRKMG